MSNFNQKYLNQLFRPTLASVFLNPFFFYRRGLYKSVSNYAPLLEGEVLDYGCGLKPYKGLFINSSRYVGVDIENPGHDHSKEEVDVYYDGRQLPFADNSFDSIFSSEVLEHVVDLVNSFSEIKRVVKPGGKILLTVPFSWMEHELPYDFRRFTKDGIVRLCEENGFRVIHVEIISHYTETLFQNWANYFYSFFQNRNKYLRLLLVMIFISPINVFGVLVNVFLPKRKSLYLGTCIFAEKK